MENRLRDLLLDIEDRIYQGTLGTVKVCQMTPLLFLKKQQLGFYTNPMFVGVCQISVY